LITGLCQSFGVPVTPTKVIRPPITQAFIEKYCTPRQVQGDAPQVADAPPPPHQADPAGSLGIGALSTALGSPAGGQPPRAGADT